MCYYCPQSLEFQLKNGAKKQYFIFFIYKYLNNIFYFYFNFIIGAAIAGLDVISLIKENTAAALYYGKDRIDKENHYVIFYNIGSYNI